MTAVELRPLSLGELLDRTFGLYRQHLWLFAGIMALPAMVWYGFAFIFPGPENPLEGLFGPSGPPGPVRVVSTGDALVNLAILYAYVALYLASYALAMGAGTFAVSEVQLGRSATIGGSYRQAAGRVGGLLDLFFSVGLRVVGCVFLSTILMTVTVLALPRGWRDEVLFLTLVGLLVFALGAGLTIVLALGYAVALPAMLLEKTSARQAMKRSWAFTKGQRGRVFLIVALAVVIGYVAAIVFQGPFWVAMLYSRQDSLTVEVLGHLSWVAGVVAQALSGPLLVIGLVLLYFDLRVRKEGFDLQVMIDSLQPAQSRGRAPAVS